MSEKHLGMYIYIFGASSSVNYTYVCRLVHLEAANAGLPVIAIDRYVQIMCGVSG